MFAPAGNTNFRGSPLSLKLQPANSTGWPLGLYSSIQSDTNPPLVIVLRLSAWISLMTIGAGGLLTAGKPGVPLNTVLAFQLAGASGSPNGSINSNE